MFSPWHAKHKGEIALQIKGVLFVRKTSSKR